MGTREFGFLARCSHPLIDGIGLIKLGAAVLGRADSRGVYPGYRQEAEMTRPPLVPIGKTEAVVIFDAGSRIRHIQNMFRAQKDFFNVASWGWLMALT